MTVAQRLECAHFTAQQEPSNDLPRVEIAQLDPFLRSLLFTDGTVSRTLEAQTLCPVLVQAAEETWCPVPPRIAPYLQVRRDERCRRRRVTMTIAGTQPTVWAESYLVAHRLPQEFLAQLQGNTQGIGGSLQQLKLESRRELLWFGLGPPPKWAGVATATKSSLTRVYRVFTDGLASLLISESFAVRMAAAQYRLDFTTDAQASAANGR